MTNDNNEIEKTMYHNDKICPVCGEEYTNWVDNGYRNGWPTKDEEDIATIKFEVCTPSDSDYMYVHTQNIEQMMCGDGLADLQESRSD